jgi:hypothetical protein
MKTIAVLLMFAVLSAKHAGSSARVESSEQNIRNAIPVASANQQSVPSKDCGKSATQSPVPAPASHVATTGWYRSPEWWLFIIAMPTLFFGKRPSNTPVSGIVFVMNSGHECGRWSVGWSS